MRNRRHLSGLAAMVLAGLLFSVASAEPSSGPAAQVQQTVDAVLGILRHRDLAPEVRRQEIVRLVQGRFDFHTMARGALAANWKRATAQEQERFTELFGRLLESTYLGRIEAYTDERVEYRGERVEGDRAEVRTVIVSNVEIPVEYRLRQEGGRWLVYDVVVEGVSLVRNYRSTYGEIVKREGIGGLLAQMEAKSRELRPDGAGSATR